MSRKMGRAALAAVWLASVGPGVARATAQTTNFGPYAPDASKPRAPGWTLTPGIAWGIERDDNPLSRSNGDEPVGDTTNVITPSVGLSRTGRYDQLTGFYSGDFLRYRQFGSLNSYDQQASLAYRRLLSKRLTLVADESFARAPTTELVQFVGLPFVRTGSTIEDARGGLDAKLTGRMDLSASYNFQLLRFDPSTLAPQLQGGHSHGVIASWRYKVSELTTLVADYDGQKATVTNGLGTFTIQNIFGGVERRVSEFTSVFGSVGLARVAVSAYGPAKSGLAWRGGIARQFRRAGFDLSYSRSFVPSYSFGGTLQNEEVIGRARVPLGRRISAQSSIAWRSNQELTVGQPNLHSFWVEGNLGYAWQPWLRLEGFYTSSSQTIDRPGGVVDRRQIGIQVVTTTDLRMR